MINFVNVELTNLAVRFRTHRIAVNVNKTKFILFHTRGTKLETQNYRNLFQQYHNNHRIPDKWSYKLLGIYFDEHLSFDMHTTHLCNNLNKSFFCISQAKNFLTPRALLSLYYATMQSFIRNLAYCRIGFSCATASYNKKNSNNTQESSLYHSQQKV